MPLVPIDQKEKGLQNPQIQNLVASTDDPLQQWEMDNAVISHLAAYQ